MPEQSQLDSSRLLAVTLLLDGWPRYVLGGAGIAMLVCVGLLSRAAGRTDPS